eukprot:scaffold1906_cov403-Prasinococcus_capsulatus_cf.AAC.9
MPRHGHLAPVMHGLASPAGGANAQIAWQGLRKPTDKGPPASVVDPSDPRQSGRDARPWLERASCLRGSARDRDVREPYLRRARTHSNVTATGRRGALIVWKACRNRPSP